MQADKLVRRVRGRRYRLTDEGRKAAGVDDDDSEIERTVEDRGGAASKKEFYGLRGMKQRATVPCAFCGQTGDVYKWADGRQPKEQRHYADLHEDCVKSYFAGNPKPKTDPPKWPKGIPF